MEKELAEAHDAFLALSFEERCYKAGAITKEAYLETLKKYYKKYRKFLNQCDSFE